MEEKMRWRRPRWKRKREVLRILGQYPRLTLTMRWIAFWLDGMEPSTHLLKILHEMEAERMIKSTRTAYRKNATVLCWEITEIGRVVLATICEIEK